MKDIKFRAFETINAKKPRMVYFDIWGLDGYYAMDESINLSDEAQNSIMQYTGLKDKNGKKIYEGDIISGKDGLGNDNITSVVFIDGGFSPLCLGDMSWRDVKVLGNIYQNKELLSTMD